MRKLTKKALSLMLCLLLVVSAISGAFSISAETVVNDAPLNLNFSSGLDNWTGSTANFAATEGALQTTAGSGWDNYIATERFTIPNLKAGQKILLRFNFAIDSEKLTGSTEPIARVRMDHYAEDGTSLTASTFPYAQFTEASLSGVRNLNYALEAKSAADSFKITIYGVSSTVGLWSISDITVLASNEINNSTTGEGAWTNGTLSSYTDSRTYTYRAYVNGTTSQTVYFDYTVEGGTEANGYTYNLSIADSTVPIDFYGTLAAPKNLDFSSGLKYWGSLISNTGAKGVSASDEVASVANGIVTLKAKDRNNSGLTTQKFALSGINAGDTVTAIIEWKAVEGDEEKTLDAYLLLRSFRSEGAKLQGKPYAWNWNSSGAGTDTIQNSTQSSSVASYVMGEEDGWKRSSVSITATNADDLFQIAFGYGEQVKTAITDDTGATTGYDYSAAAQLQFRNVYIVKSNATGGYIDLSTNEQIGKDLKPFGGTEEKGIPATYTDGYRHTFVYSNSYLANTSYFGVTNGLVNGDFSKGFKHWSVFAYKSTVAATKDLSGIATVSNGTVNFKAITTDDAGVDISSNTDIGMVSQPFTLSGIEAGDKIVLGFDASKDARFAAGIYEYSSTISSNQQGPASWTVNYSKTETNFNGPYGLWLSNKLTVINPDNHFMVRITKSVASAATSIKNVRIFKVLEDNSLVDITTGYTEGAAAVNANGGSAENGLLTAGSYTIPTASDVINGDFTDGLKYWRASKGKSGYASIYTEVVNGTAVITRYADGNGAQSGIRTPEISLDAFAGKSLVFAYDATDMDRVSYGDALNANVTVKVYEDGTAVYTSSAAGYKGSFKTTAVTVKEGSTYSLEIYNGGDAGSTITVDNVRLLFAEAGANATYYTNVAGETLFGTALGYQTFGGTEADGIKVVGTGDYNGYGLPGTAKTYNSVTAVEGFKNGNFSEGFKYWTLTTTYGNTYNTPSQIASITDGVVTFKNTIDTGIGLASQGFTVKGLKEDDVLYAVADFRNVTNGAIDMRLYALYKDANGTLQGADVSNVGSGRASGSDPTLWETVSSAGVTVESTDAVFYVALGRHGKTAGDEIKNIRVVRNDRGGLKKLVETTDEETGTVTTTLEDVIVRVNADGTLQEGQVYGDANYDGALNLLDIVRMKKQAADMNDLGVFLAAVDADADDTVGAADFAAVIGYILDLKK